MRDPITLCPPDDMSHFTHNLIFTNLLIDAHHLLSLQLSDQGLNLEMNLSDSEGSRQLWFWMRDVGSITHISGPFLWVCLLVFLFPSVLLLSCAISHQPEENIFQELTEPSVIEQGAYILIAAGAFIFIISFLGECKL